MSGEIEIGFKLLVNKNILKKLGYSIVSLPLAVKFNSSAVIKFFKQSFFSWPTLPLISLICNTNLFCNEILKLPKTLIISSSFFTNELPNIFAKKFVKKSLPTPS